MKSSIALALTALALGPATANAQDYLRPQTGFTALTAETWRRPVDATYAWQAAYVQVPDFFLPAGTQLGADVPVNLVGIIHVRQAATYLPVPVLSIEVRDIDFAVGAHD